MNKNKRGYDILAQDIEDVFINLLQISNSQVVDREKTAFQLGKLNHIVSLVNNIEQFNHKGMNVIVSVTVKEKGVNK